MGFQQGLSGLNATSKNLEIIGNNVANEIHGNNGADDIEGLLQLAADEGVDLTVVGPEVPLVAAISPGCNSCRTATAAGRSGPVAKSQYPTIASTSPTPCNGRA